MSRHAAGDICHVCRLWAAFFPGEDVVYSSRNSEEKTEERNRLNKGKYSAMKRSVLHLKRVIPICLLICLLLLPAVSPGEQAFSSDADAIEKAADSVFMLEVYSYNNQRIAVGSGFVAFDSATLVTNYHVIEGGSYVVAISDDKEQYLVSSLCCYDKAKDIAILRFDRATGAEPLPLDTDGQLKRSQTVVAIGSPAGLRNTVSLGNISAFYTEGGKDWIQFTAPISSGSSGGVLLNDEGEVIGITTATYASAQNVNMAVKVQEVIRLYEKWDKKTLSKIGSMRGNSYPSVTGAKDSGGNTTVWVTASGSKYHNNPNCSKMRNPLQMDLLEAIERGYEPCGKCYK